MAETLTGSETHEHTGPQGIEKSPTGIDGFDDVTDGGLPKDRVSLLTGGPGCGKTLFAVEYIVRGASEFDEPGVFMAFEESEQELKDNVRGLGLDVGSLVDAGKVSLDFVFLEPSEFEETGEFDLEGLFVRLDYAIESIGAKRVVLDTVEALFAGLPNEAIVRAEIRRLFRWLKERGVTAIVTGERGTESITRYGLEEYVSDCVVILDHRVTEQVSTRRLRIAKYRGSKHGTNEFPFIIGDAGISVLPVTSLHLDHSASTERISSGVRHLDEMLGGEGFYRGSTVLVTGGPGAGKTSLVASFVEAACARGERAMMFAFEEGPRQVIRNMKSIGIDLDGWLDDGLLEIIASRPATFGLEMHLARIQKSVDDFEPSVVTVDPVTNFLSVGSASQVLDMLVRAIDYLKYQGITAMLTFPTTFGQEPGVSDSFHVSSLVDTWICLQITSTNDERNKFLSVLKSRGMAHSAMVHELFMSEEGISLLPGKTE